MTVHVVGRPSCSECCHLPSSLEGCWASFVQGKEEVGFLPADVLLGWWWLLFQFVQRGFSTDDFSASTFECCRFPSSLEGCWVLFVQGKDEVGFLPVGMCFWVGVGCSFVLPSMDFRPTTSPLRRPNAVACLLHWRAVRRCLYRGKRRRISFQQMCFWVGVGCFSVRDLAPSFPWECFIVVATLGSSSVDEFSALESECCRLPPSLEVRFALDVVFSRGKEVASSLPVGVLMGKRAHIFFPCECRSVLGKRTHILFPCECFDAVFAILGLFSDDF
jgi:hypothetical protein